MSALLRALSKYSSQISTNSSASTAAARSIVSLSSRLQTICSPFNACLSSPKIVFSPLNCSTKAGKNSGSSWILLIMWLTKLRCKCTQCHDPSHGGFYMAEGASYIRIGLPPRVVSGDCLVLSLFTDLLIVTFISARACSMSDVR